MFWSLNSDFLSVKKELLTNTRGVIYIFISERDL